MKNTIIGFAIASFLIVAPFAASAQSIDLQAQINGLLEQIKTLQLKIADLVKQQSATVPTDSTTPASPNMRICALLNRNLSQGQSGDDVSGLQEFLSTKGFLSANATGFFGPMTADAVAKWQASEGVSSVGSIGPMSRERIRIWCGGNGGGTGGVSNGDLKAAPAQGSAPLTVKFAASVKTQNHSVIADAQDVKIVFGDGSEYVFSCTDSSGTCAGPQSTSHTYTSNGSYTAQLVRYGGFGGPQVSNTIASVTIVVGASTTGCRPLMYMPILCDGGTPSKPVYDSNGCLAKYECPVVSFTPSANCKVWNDGCNTCSRATPDSPAACTMRACLMTTNTDVGGMAQSIWAGKGYCSVYFDTSATSTPSNKPPVISSFSGPTTLALNVAGTWSVGASDPQNGQLNYQITWGDESSSMVPLSGSAMTSAQFVQSTTFSHAYSVAGIYTVKMHVTGSGGVASASATVQVGSGIACTTEYAPVCGQPAEPACRHAVPACMIATPGPTTYSNRCVMNAAGAIFISTGVCASTPTPVACTADARMCPDGTYVGRTGSNCEFVCPTTSTVCPQYQMPLCPNGTVTAGPASANGCAGAPVCHTNTM